MSDTGTAREHFDPVTSFMVSLLRRSRPDADAGLTGRDWARLDAVSDRHGVAGLVADLLAADNSVPTATRNALRARAHAQAAERCRA